MYKYGSESTLQPSPPPAPSLSSSHSLSLSSWLSSWSLSFGYGSKRKKNLGITGFGLLFLLPIGFFGCPFLTHSHLSKLIFFDILLVFTSHHPHLPHPSHYPRMAATAPATWNASSLFTPWLREISLQAFVWTWQHPLVTAWLAGGLVSNILDIRHCRICSKATIWSLCHIRSAYYLLLADALPCHQQQFFRAKGAENHETGPPTIRAL